MSKIAAGQVSRQVNMQVASTAKVVEKQESLFEMNRKNKIKDTKRVYSMCATYHRGLNLLAISLIDKEIKLY